MAYELAIAGTTEESFSVGNGPGNKTIVAKTGAANPPSWRWNDDPAALRWETSTDGVNFDAVESPWRYGPKPTRSLDGEFNVTHNAHNEALLKPGRPIKFSNGAGSVRYGIVSTYTSGAPATVTFVGAPMEAGWDDALWVGDYALVVRENWNIPGPWAATNTVTLLQQVAKRRHVWTGGRAFFCFYRAWTWQQDTGGIAYPHVNVTLGASAALCTANGSLGLEVRNVWNTSAVDIIPGNYVVNQGDEMELTCDAGGTNDDSTDLTVELAWVLEG